MDYNTIFVGMDVHKENFPLAVIRLKRMSFPILIQQPPIISMYLPISLPYGTFSVKMCLSCAAMRLDVWDLLYIIN